MIASFLQAILIGAVQGITEFLPVSSTGHLLVLSQVLGLDQEKFGLTLVLFTNIATTVAVIGYFWKDLSELLTSLWSSIRSRRLAPQSLEESLPFWIVGVTALVGIAGLSAPNILNAIERDAELSLRVIASTLISFGGMMLLAEKYANSLQKKTDLTTGKAYAIGLAQILAFIPGVSRSGATISTGLFLGLERAKAARYSFLLSVPITALASLKQMVSERETLVSVFQNTNDTVFYVTAFVVTLITSYWTIHALLKYLQHASLAAFAYYRFALGAAIFLYLAF